MNTWNVEVSLGEENHVAQGHYDDITALMAPGTMDARFGEATKLAEVEMQALISGPYSNSRIVSTVRLNCHQTLDIVSMAQTKAIELSMEGLRNGWEILQERIKKGHFPGVGQ